MEQYFFDIAKFATPSLAFIILTIKVLVPWSTLLIARYNKTDTSAQARLDKIQGNDLADLSDFKTRVYGLENKMDAMQRDIQGQFGVMGERIAIIEERTRKT